MDIRVIIGHSPKLHLEFSGEGIEYNWVQSKIYRRNTTAMQQKSIKKYHVSVNLALSQANGVNLTKNLIYKFRAQSRDYMVTYFIISTNQMRVINNQRHQ